MEHEGGAFKVNSRICLAQLRNQVFLLVFSTLAAARRP